MKKKKKKLTLPTHHEGELMRCIAGMERTTADLQAGIARVRGLIAACSLVSVGGRVGDVAPDHVDMPPSRVSGG